MPASVKRKLSTIAATEQAAQYLERTDLKRLSIALAEAAAEEVESNAAFAHKVLVLYDSLAPTKPAPAKKKETTTKQLVPIRPVEPGSLDVSSAVPLDPYWLNEVFGSHQLAEALDRYPAVKVKEASAMVEKRNPGTKPKSRANKAAMVQYIVEQVAK